MGFAVVVSRPFFPGRFRLLLHLLLHLLLLMDDVLSGRQASTLDLSLKLGGFGVHLVRIGP